MRAGRNESVLRTLRRQAPLVRYAEDEWFPHRLGAVLKWRNSLGLADEMQMGFLHRVDFITQGS